MLKNKEEELINKLTSSGLNQVGTQEVEGFTLKFFFSSQPDVIDIWWVETYRNFLGDIEPPQNLIYFAVLLISGECVCYAVSLGKSHFYLSQFCDMDFGLNLAERILDESNLKIKNSKFYKSAKSKTITAYQNGNQISFDSGESMHYIKGKTIDSSTWGSTASFGNSVYLNISKAPDELASLINQIEEVLRQPIRIKLPRVGIVRDRSTQQRLDRALARTILGIQNNSDINVEEFTVSGVDFIFTDNSSYSLYLKGHSNEAVRLAELNISSLVSFVRNHQINLIANIDKLRIKVHNEYGRDYSRPLKFYLDFIEEDFIEENERYCLIDGKWHKFSQSYLDYLREEVDKIDITYDRNFDITSNVSEEVFNQNRVQDGYLNYDRDITMLNGRYRVEKMDLVKDNVLYFVKKGSPQKLSYVVDQAINTIKILQSNVDNIEINNQTVHVSGICLWLILSNRNRISKLSDLNSIIFQMKLVEWIKTSKDAGFQPSVNINYII